MSEPATWTDSYVAPVPDSPSSSNAVSASSSLTLPDLSSPVVPSFLSRHPSLVTRHSSLLVLADGTTISGQGIGAPGVVVGELVFQTAMVGYQEAMTDPSYAGQMLIFTYPLVGNYGVGNRSSQSKHIQVQAVILRDAMVSGGHRDSLGELDAMMREQGVPGIAGVDTRYLTRVVRTHGVLPAALATGPADELPSIAALQAQAAALDYDGTDFVASCSTPELIWHAPSQPEAPRIALIDYGVKQSILDRLHKTGAGVWQVPARMSAAEIMALQPDAVMLSNGPGDPTRLGYAVDTIREIIGLPEMPVFGICLGNQLLALAAGGHTSKMRFGHRGVNQPVLDTETGRLSVTTQNHGYVVDPDGLPADFRVTHSNLNDGSVEGIAHVSRPIWGVQWHPEAGPGPTDTVDFITKFVAAAEKNNGA